MTRTAARATGAARAEPMQYYDPVLKSQAAKLLPAEYFATGRDIALVTVLGSCVAACLHDPLLRVGGMNHFMLPDGDSADGGEPARYGVHAMELLVNELLKLGARRDRIEAKLFGGGNVLKSFTSNQVGTRNAQFALDYLHAEGITLLAQDLGGIHPRKVAFFPVTGRAFVRQLPHAHDAEIAAEERAYRQRLRSAPVAGSVELF
jgi:chemotaxis protein CheD